MTENEAINVLKMVEAHGGLVIEAKVMAIKALEEIQPYRAIGTVEGYERAIKSSVENYNLYREYKAKVQEFEAIGTIDEFKDLKEKNEPKKIRYINGNYYCNSCGKPAMAVSARKKNYCDFCGQKLDWSE